MAARVTVEDVRKWTELVALLMPAGVQVATLGVQAVAGVIKAIKRLRGEAPTEGDAEELAVAAEVVTMLTAAQAPWLRIRQRADAELAKLGPSERS